MAKKISEFVLIAKLLSLMCATDGLTNDTASYVININQNGAYYLWLRCKAAPNQNCSVKVSMDEGLMNSISYSDYQTLIWKKVDFVYNLSQGSHKITLSTEASGTYIDKIILTAEASYVPSNSGPSALTASSIVQLSKVIALSNKGGIPIMGDINNDGKIDYVISGSAYISVYDNSGTLTWETAISANKLSYVGDGAYYCRPIDIDNDGMAEVVGIVCINNIAYLASLDGLTGNVESTFQLPVLSNGWYYDATQIANLRGLSKSQDVIIKLAYDGYVPFKLAAYKYENNLFQLLWEFSSQSGETRAGCHRPKVYDIDEDGYDEVLFGHWTLEENGSIKWQKPDGFFDSNNHVDSIDPGDIIPSNPGIEIAYSSGNVVLASNGDLLWRKDEFRNIDGQSVKITEMRPDLPGREVLFAYQDPDNDERLFSSTGTLLWTFDGSAEFMASYETYPIQWLGDEGFESVRQEWGRDRSPAIYDEYNNFVTLMRPELGYGEIGYRACDVLGDYREELVCFNANYILVYENIAPNPRSFPSLWSNPIYVKSQYNWDYY